MSGTTTCNAYDLLRLMGVPARTLDKYNSVRLEEVRHQWVLRFATRNRTWYDLPVTIDPTHKFIIEETELLKFVLSTE